jgi:hypothetical protein
VCEYLISTQFNKKAEVFFVCAAVLGSEYCSGYIDSLGKWNTGFYCPSMEESIDVFCCGSATHKYCCTKRDQVIQTEVEG